MTTVLATATLAIALAFAPPGGMSVDSHDIVEHRYTLDELDILATKEAWAELVLRLQDVPSPQRTERWEKLVERGALGYLSALASEGMGGAERVAAEMTKSYPSLRRSKAFMSQRNAVGLLAFENCFAGPVEDRECVASLLAFVADDRENVDFVLKASRLVAEKQGPAGAIPFYELALSPNTRAAVCASAEVRKTILGALAAGKGAATAAGELVDKHCWAWMKTDLTKEVDRRPAGAFVDAACELLKKKGAAAEKCAPKKP